MEMKTAGKKIEDWLVKNCGQVNPDWNIEGLAKEVELIDEVSLKEIRDKIYNISDQLYTGSIDGVDASSALDAIVDELDNIIE